MPGPLITADQQRVLGLLAVQGVVTSRQLQTALKRSQPTVSRLIAGLSSHVLSLGSARAAQYGLPKPIRGETAQQPLWATSESGETRRVGTLSFLAQDIIFVDAEFGSSSTRGRLPWFLAPLRAQGFLGRLHAQRLSASGIGTNPEHWSVENVLFGALHLADAPGALSIGEPLAIGRRHPQLRGNCEADLDDIARDVVQTLPAGSSAGGEQPKFLAVRAVDRSHVLVKFSPPRGTPFGERWSDLLHAEALASKVLAAHGADVAASETIETAQRTYLVSERFDRVGAHGRRHVVSIGDAHEAFVPGPYGNWAASAEALARQQRLERSDALKAAALLQFGRLIGNSDMHAGNLGLFVDDVGHGRFRLAPIYDMLPMRWRPDAVAGMAHDYAAFAPDALSLASGAVAPARDFWSRLAELTPVSAPLRAVAATMVSRLSA